MQGRAKHRHGKSKGTLRRTPGLVSSRDKSEAEDASRILGRGSSRMRLDTTYTAGLLGPTERPVWMKSDSR